MLPFAVDHRPRSSRKRSARLLLLGFFFLFKGRINNCLCLLPSLCVSHLSEKSPPLPPQKKAAKDYKPVLIPAYQRPRFGKKKESSCEDVRCTSCFLGFNIYMYIYIIYIYIYIYILLDSSPLPLPLPRFFGFLSSYMYGLYSVCASLLCETSKNTKQKR